MQWRWHSDKNRDNAIAELLDALWELERAAGSKSLLVLIPADRKEKVVIADSGRPIDGSLLTDEDLLQRVRDSLKARDGASDPAS